MSQTHVVIVNFNSGDWLLRALHSALQCSDGPVTVVDNNSTDSSLASARKALDTQSRIDWICNSQNVGFAAANNQALKTVKEPFVVLQNPDCELNESTLPTMLAYFHEYQQLGLASCRIINEDGSIQATCKRRFPTPTSALSRMLRLYRLFPSRAEFADFNYGDIETESTEIEFPEAISGAFMVVRNDAMQQVGLLDEGYFMHCEDLDWCMRFANAGWRVGFINNASVLHAKGISSQSRPLRVLWSLHRGMSRFFDKFYRERYSILTRGLVKLGIYASFLLRAGLVPFRR